ncbi:hypothetical protein BJF90_31075 [Pseudonocardia sp. CNS-004]|nr:hypothetical protein BJF90_31075 [Pseudonocardia sp. CNS-004]
MTAEHTSRAVQVTRRPITTAAADGVPLEGVHLAAEGSGRGTALAVTHAFTHHVRHPITRGVLAALAAEAPVVALDMRGHGRSGGRNTVATGRPSTSTPRWPWRAASATNTWSRSGSPSAPR